MSASGANYLNILVALQQAVKAFNDANPVTISGQYANEPLDLVFENERYVPVIGRPYMEVTLLPGATQQPGNGVDGTEYDTGVLHVDLFYPRDEGAGPALGRAQLLRGWFKRSTLVSHGGTVVRLPSRASIAPGMNNEAWHKRVVTIPYFLYS